MSKLQNRSHRSLRLLFQELRGNKQSLKYESTSLDSTATMRYWMKKTTNATFGIDKGELVQVALLQIHGGHGAYL